jgi:hypothetical protein
LQYLGKPIIQFRQVLLQQGIHYLGVSLARLDCLQNLNQEIEVSFLDCLLHVPTRL